MREYAKEQIIENYGEEVLQKIENAGYKENMLLVYAEGDVFEIIGGILTNHGMSVDDALDLLDINMDDWSDKQGWDGWNWEALNLVDVE